MVAVAIETQAAFKAGEPEKLFREAYYSLGNNTWDIHPDGKRFLMIKPPPSTGAVPTAAGPQKINVVLNWFEELKQRVPVK